MAHNPASTQPDPKPMNYLITGAARGIGRHLSRSLVSRGHRVFLLDNNEAELQNTLKLLSTESKSQDRSSKNLEHSICDLASRASIRDAVSSAKSFFEGHLDVLINNAMALPHVWSSTSESRAGVDASSAGMDAGDDEEVMAQWDAKIAVGLSAPFYLSRLCVPLLSNSSASRGADQQDRGNGQRRRGGVIINVSSTRAHQAELDHEGYSAAKAGLLGLTQSMAVSLGSRHGIRVNAITPGWVHVAEESAQADRDRTQWQDELRAEDHEWHPAGRVGKGEDIARAVEYLVSSDFVTGEEIRVDGGVGRLMVYPD